MKFIALLILAFLTFFLWEFIFMVLGYLLCHTKKFHRVGIRFLAMSMFVSGRKVAKNCRMICPESKCGNWTCEYYHYAIRR